MSNRLILLASILLAGCSYDPLIVRSETQFLESALQLMPPITPRNGNVSFKAQPTNTGLVDAVKSFSDNQREVFKYPATEMLAYAVAASIKRWFRQDSNITDAFIVEASIERLSYATFPDIVAFYPGVAITINMTITDNHGDVIHQGKYQYSARGEAITGWSTYGDEKFEKQFSVATYQALLGALDEGMANIARQRKQ